MSGAPVKVENVGRLLGLVQLLCAPTCFELSADGKEFVSATATVRGKQVSVHCDKIPTPKFVRMGWFDTAIPTLRDKNGWPALIFPAQEVK